MGKYLFQYHEVFPTTWVYLSSLLMVGLFFKFGRFWSVRNLDLLLLILLAPGLLLVYFGFEMRSPGVDFSGAFAIAREILGLSPEETARKILSEYPEKKIVAHVAEDQNRAITGFCAASYP